LASSAAETDRAQIAALYLWLDRLTPSGPVRLSRVVAVSKAYPLRASGSAGRPGAEAGQRRNSSVPADISRRLLGTATFDMENSANVAGSAR
jgi:predicted RNA polymerase sigma factor